MSGSKQPKNQKGYQAAGGPPSHKKKFDPQGALESIREKVSLIKKVQDACEELVKVAGEVLNNDAYFTTAEQ